MDGSLLITGGAGYLGSHIIHRLVHNFQNNEKVNFQKIDVIDDLSTGFLEALPNRSSQLAGLELEFYKLDLRDQASCRNFFLERQYDTVIHLAGKLKVSESVLNPLAYYESNVTALLTILKSLQLRKKTNFIFSSTAAVYGNSNRSTPFDEDDPLAPTSPYGQSKLFCEYLLKDFAATNSNFKYVALRYFNIAGASDDLQVGQRTLGAYHLIHVAAKVALKLIPTLQIYGDTRATKDGTCIRDYIHVEDLVDIHLLAAKYLTENQNSCTLNCGYQTETSVKEVVHAMEKVLGSKLNTAFAKNRPGDPDYSVASNRRILTEFGWQPKRNDLLKICGSALDWERKLTQS